MVMTIKEASLLALNTLSEIQQVINENVGNGTLTRLCGAMFNYDSVSLIQKGGMFGDVPNICKVLSASLAEQC